MILVLAKANVNDIVDLSTNYCSHKMRLDIKYSCLSRNCLSVKYENVLLILILIRVEHFIA